MNTVPAVPEPAVPERGWQKYHTIWLMLFLGWVFSASDRGVTGPVVTWMINDHVAFFAHAHNEYALGGLIGGLFFASFMLTQFPGGYIGDKVGSRTTIILSLIWAGIATLVGGFMFTLIGFIVFRVITGLGEGMFYSNDRAILSESTPLKKRSLAMGITISGLTVGTSLAYVLTGLMSKWGDQLFGKGHGWAAPFYIFGVLTLLVGIAFSMFFKREGKEKIRVGSGFASSLKFSIPSFIAVVLIYYLSEKFHINNTITAVIEIVMALVIIGFSFAKLGGELAPVLKNKNLVLLYISAFPFLWNFWFFNFWSGALIQKTGHASFLVSALLYAVFNAGAGLIGYPLGGKLSDWARDRGIGRKRIYMIFIPVNVIFTAALGFYLMANGHSLLVTGVLLFFCNLFLNLIQPVNQSMTADLAEPKLRASAFGMWNLIAEIGSVLSPVVGGALMDSTHQWYPAVFLGGAIMLVTMITAGLVKERTSAL